MRPARLILEDATTYEGESFGATSDSIGEVVFNTSQTGYQEIATDPSYRFQIVVMTTPEMGNYGVRDDADQSERPQVAGFVVREISTRASHPNTARDLGSWFSDQQIPAIAGVDTRAITLKIRSEGAMKGLITTDAELTVEDAVKRLAEAPSMSGLDLVSRVTSLRPWEFDEQPESVRRRVAVYDYGVKKDILRRLTAEGCSLTIYPATTHPDEILNAGFDGVLLSNGPGDPEPVGYAQENIRKLIGRVPILGICLGHQLLGLALGGKTYKLKFGHRGGNHPVKQLASGQIEITAQNHGFSVDPDSLKESDVEFTHVNLNDGTLEGFRHRSEPVIAVQYHPEAAPGPHDSFHVFRDFMSLMDTWKSNGKG